MSDKICYEPHPVTPERKKELREQGFTIIDARFDPDYVPPQPKKRGRPKKENATVEAAETTEPVTDNGADS